MKQLFIVVILTLSFVAINAQDEELCCPVEFDACLVDELCQPTIVECIEKVSNDSTEEINEQAYLQCISQNVFAQTYINCSTINCSGDQLQKKNLRF